MISREKWASLRRLMETLGLNEADINEQFILGAGAGGQKINKTHSCVQLQHQPTGISIRCQKSRLRDDNRYFARKRLCEKVDAEINQAKSAVAQAADKIRRQKKRRSRKAKQKMMDNKSHRANVKAVRKKPSRHGDGH